MASETALEGDPRASVMYSRQSMTALIAVLVQKLGGTVEITQEEFNSVPAFDLLEESGEGKLKLAMTPQDKSAMQ